MIINIINLSFFTFPASLILALLYVLVLWLLVYYYRSTWLFRVLRNMKTAIVLTLLFVLVIMIEGIYGIGLYRTYIFAILAFLFMSSLGVVTLDRSIHHFNLGFFLNHMGLFLVCWAMFFGAPDYEELRLVAKTGEPARMAYSSQGDVVPLPFTVQLDSFQVAYYADGVTPRAYTSWLQIDGSQKQLSVNHPIHKKGYDIYQNSYDKQHLDYSVLQIVHDPWLIVVWLGVLLLGVGSFMMLLIKR